MKFPQKPTQIFLKSEIKRIMLGIQAEMDNNQNFIQVTKGIKQKSFQFEPNI